MQQTEHTHTEIHEKAWYYSFILPLLTISLLCSKGFGLLSLVSQSRLCIDCKEIQTAPGGLLAGPLGPADRAQWGAA